MAKVTDFGIAKAVSNSTITAFGTTIGSVHYFSPEHAKGGYTDAKSDLYSLGIVMYEMLTGRVPFDADTPVSVALMQVQEEPIEPMKLNPQIPISVDHIILKAMQKSPNDRYASATDMLIDLSTALKRPDDDFVVFAHKPNDYQTQRISTLYDIDEKAIPVRNEQENRKEYNNRNKKENKFFAFFKNHVIISVILIGILLFGLALGGTILFMNVTKDKEAYIPNLVTNTSGDRLTLEEAQKIFDDTAFKSELQVKYELSKEVEPGYVIRQDPEYSTINNKRMKLTQEFTIWVSEDRKKIETPSNKDIVGKEKDEVLEKLAELGFTNVKVEEKNHATLKAGLVIELSSEEKEQYADDEIIVYVSSGDGKVDVPDVLGKTEKEAKTELKDAGFKVKVKYDLNKSKEDGIVLKQSATKADEGSTITITVNKYPKDVSASVTIDVASLIGYTEKTDEDGNVITPETVLVSVFVYNEDGEGLKDKSSKVLENTKEFKVDFEGHGEVTIEVSIGDGYKESFTMNLDKEKSKIIK